MTIYPKATISKEELGEILAEYIQESRKIDIDHNMDIRFMTKDGQEVCSYDIDEIFGLVCSVGAVIRRFEPAIIKQYKEFDEYGLDIYDKRGGTMLMQIDRNIHKKGVTDVRFNKDVFGGFGYTLPALQMAKNYMVSMYDD